MERRSGITRNQDDYSVYKMANTMSQMSNVKCQMSKRGGLPRQHLRSFGRGYSIVELLVVVTIFTFLAIIVTQAVVLTLRGSRKGESLISVRENLDYAFAVMERQLRSARSITSCD